jgi:two-component system, cell cycle sensor histidine kinase and response regulator CckA
MAEVAMSAEEGFGRRGTSEAEASRSETILLIEDEAFVREVTCEVLQASGYHVLAAKNATEGVCLHDRHREKIDLLITDIVLPDGNGRALADNLRQQDPKLTVLFMTGYGEQMESHEKVRPECLAKPFASGALLDHVRRLVKHQPLEPGDVVKRVCGSGSPEEYARVFAPVERCG